MVKGRETREERFRLLIVEADALCRAGLERVLSGFDGVDVVATWSGEEVVNGTPRWGGANVALVDLDLGGGRGAELAERMAGDSLAVVGVSRRVGRAHLLHALARGVRGLLPRSATPKEVILALQAVAGGGIYLHPSVQGHLAGRPSGDVELTEREATLLVLLERGASTSEIARRLYLSDKTVRNALSSLYAKLGTRSARAAVAVARDRGLL